MITLGQRLLALRNERDFTVRELEAASGVSKGYISQLERDIAVPGVDVLERLADAYCMTASDLLRGVRVTGPQMLDYSI